MAFSRRRISAVIACAGFSALCLVAIGQTRQVDLLLAAMRLSAHGGVRAQNQGYLGIDIRDVTEGEVSVLRLKSTDGAEITMVDHDGPAGKAGLREHDVVLSVNGMQVEGEDQLRKLLRELPPGHSVAMVICRSGVEQTVNATMANRAELEKQAWENHWTVPEPTYEDSYPSQAVGAHGTLSRGFMSGHLLPLTSVYTGAVVDMLSVQLADYFGVKEGRGLLVQNVDANSPAAAAGLRAGDVVTRVNGDRVGNKTDWARALHDSKGHPVSLTVVRDRHEQTLTMVPNSKHRSQVMQPEAPLTEGKLSVLLLH